MLSFGKNISINSSSDYILHESAHVRVFKNIFVGVNFESMIYKDWGYVENGLEADTISGFAADLSVLAFSNPVYRKGKSVLGFYGDLGAGIFSYYRGLGLPGGFNYYDEFKEKQYYVRLEGGVYYKYRGIILTLGCFVNDLDLSRYKGRKVTGIFRKPTEYGLNLSIRFSMW